VVKIPTEIEGCFVIEHDVYEDNRGLFYEAFNKKELKTRLGIETDFVQDNISVSKRGVLRGLHYQKENYSQAKLVQVTYGEAMDVIVDLRTNSPTYGKHIKFKLKGDDRKSIFIPKGMAHGFLALSEMVIFQYKCDAYYNSNADTGLMYNDPDLAIDWQFPKHEIILSEKDQKLPFFKSISL
jgi:dTDP-4-dehydrorhamnose 3,5-epimerase